MHLFSTPGRVHINGGPGNMQLEITDMHCTSGQKNTEALYSFISVLNIMTRRHYHQFIHTRAVFLKDEEGEIQKKNPNNQHSFEDLTSKCYLAY
jgi:hypothetical protein